jgi:hypothetical protein
MIHGSTQKDPQMFANKFGQFRRPLTDADLRYFAPSIFAEAPSAKVSERYEFIPTTRVIELLGREGWTPVHAAQSSARSDGGRMVAKHVIRFQNEALGRIDDSLPELVLTNSHNGASTFNLLAGLYRLVCSNGMVAFRPDLGNHRIKHVGFKADQVIEASYSIIQDLPKLQESVETMREVKLNRDEQTAFAKSALAIRFEDGKSPIAPDQLLLTRRIEDRDQNLWTTFNAVQENMVKGGLRGVFRQDDGRVSRQKTRAINSVSEDIRVNKALWTLAEEMRKIKAG